MAQKKTAWVLYYSNSVNTKKLADLAEDTLNNFDVKGTIGRAICLFRGLLIFAFCPYFNLPVVAFYANLKASCMYRKNFSPNFN